MTVVGQGCVCSAMGGHCQHSCVWRGYAGAESGCGRYAHFRVEHGQVADQCAQGGLLRVVGRPAHCPQVSVEEGRVEYDAAAEGPEPNAAGTSFFVLITFLE